MTSCQGPRPTAPAALVRARPSRMHQVQLIDLAVSGTVGFVTPTIRSPLAEDAPPFLGLVAHPVRWRLLRELVGSDRSVRELTELVGERQSLVSYHLTQLRNGGLVRSRRSSADGRDSYYTVDLARCGEQLQAAGGALHPALWFVPPPSPSRSPRPSRRRPQLLFLCTGNSARSQMAEALVERASGGSVEAASAGSNPKPLHPLAVRAMEQRGIDIGANRTKHLDELRSRRFDVVITLCDRVREVCPEFPGHPDLVHWSMPDPSLAGPGGRTTLRAFQRTADELERRIGFLLQLLDNPSTRRPAHAAR
jgi:ArsR family transcriptional regulator, arsenate/arsenite/antimonite-responsive transcriptional repressor / arsenate reductase (thioredoxin)